MVGGDLPLFYFGRHAGLLIHTSPAHKPHVNPRYTQISNLPPARWLSKCLEHIKAILNGLCRGDWIRTSDLCVPNAARYRTTLHPE